MPVGTLFRHCVKQFYVHALVYHAEEPKARARNRGLIRRVCGDRASLSEVLRVNARRKGVDIFMQVALGFVKTLSAREDQIGAIEEIGLALFQRSGSILERRQL